APPPSTLVNRHRPLPLDRLPRLRPGLRATGSLLHKNRAPTTLRTRISRTARRQRHHGQRRPLLPSPPRHAKRPAASSNDFLLSSRRHAASKTRSRLALPRSLLRSRRKPVAVPFLTRTFRAHSSKRSTALAHRKRPSPANANSPHLETVRNARNYR